MTGKWDTHTKPQFGQEHVGEQVACMEVLGKSKTDRGYQMDLGCSECETKFTAQLWEGGDHTVQRKTDDGQGMELHVKCPGCGCEWSGTHRRFYGLGVETGSGMLREIGFFDSVEAKSPFEAMRLAFEQNLIPEEAMNDPNIQNLQIQEIAWSDHRLLHIRKRVSDALKARDPNLVQIKAQAAQEEHDLIRGRKERRRDTMPSVADLVETLLGGRPIGMRTGEEQGVPAGDKQRRKVSASSE